MKVPKKIKDEVWEYCRLNDITDIDNFMVKMLEQGYGVEKYGTSPFGNKPIKDKEPEVIEKIVEKEVIKEVVVIKEVPVEVIKEVTIEVIKEVDVIKEVFVSDDEAVSRLQKELDETTESYNKNLAGLIKDAKVSDKVWEKQEKVIGSLQNTHDELCDELDDLRQKLDDKLDDKYKKFWEEEIESHGKSKEKIKELNETILHLQGFSSTDEKDFYGENKGGWGRGSNLPNRKK